MIPTHDTLDRTARRTATVAVPLLVAATGTAAAHGGYGGMAGGGSMGGGGWGLFGGTMGLLGVLWMGLLLAVPAVLVYLLVSRGSDGGTVRSEETRPLSVLRERYARGELSDEEFERRRTRLERDG